MPPHDSFDADTEAALHELLAKQAPRSILQKQADRQAAAAEQSVDSAGFESLQDLLNGIASPAESHDDYDDEMTPVDRLRSRSCKTPNRVQTLARGPSTLPVRWRESVARAYAEAGMLEPLKKTYPSPTVKRGFELMGSSQSPTTTKQRVKGQMMTRLLEPRRRLEAMLDEKPTHSQSQLNMPPLGLDNTGQVRSEIKTPRVFLRQQSGQTEEEREVGPVPTLFVVRRWLDSFQTEEQNYESVALFYETRLREAMVQTEGMEVPNRARTAMCCDLLLKMPKLVGRYEPLFSKVITEVLRGVYRHYRNEKVNAETLYSEHHTFYDSAATLRKRVEGLHEQLKDEADGAGLIKIFRDKFLLWNGRNLLLRRMLFKLWRKHTRVMVAGHARLGKRRTQYWFDRLWEGIEQEREDAETMRALQSSFRREDDTEKRKQSAVSRRSRRETRRSSVFEDQTKGSPARKKLASSRTVIEEEEEVDESFIETSLRAGDVILQYLGKRAFREKLLRRLQKMYSKNQPVSKVACVQACMKLVEASSLGPLKFASQCYVETREILVPLVGLDVAPRSDTDCDFVGWLGGISWPILTDWVCQEGAMMPEKSQIARLGPVFREKLPPDLLLKLIAAGCSAEQSTQTDPADYTIATVSKKKGRLGKKEKPAEKLFFSSDEDASSSVAVSSCLLLVPLLYDRLLICCNGDVEDALKIDMRDLGMQAMIRRFGVKSIAESYLYGLLRTTQLCADKSPRIRLFALLFETQLTTALSEAAAAAAHTAKKKAIGKKKKTPVPQQQQVIVKRPGSTIAGREKKHASANVGALALFCELLHNYFAALQVFELGSAAMNKEKVQNRKKVREAMRVMKSDQRPSLLQLVETRTFLGLMPPSQVDNFVETVLKQLQEFSGSRQGDLTILASKLKVYEYKANSVVLKEKAVSPAQLFIATQGEAKVTVETTAMGGETSTQLVKIMKAPFVIGEGRLLTGEPTNATVTCCAGGTLRVYSLSLEDFEQLLDENNSALAGLQLAAVQRAEDRTRILGLSVGRERLTVYRDFFTDVDVMRQGKISLAEILEGLRERGSKVAVRDLERAFQACTRKKQTEPDAPAELMSFDQFVEMSDAMNRRGKQIFERPQISDVLLHKEHTGYVLVEAFELALERTWRHSATHEPARYEAIVKELGAIPRQQVSQTATFTGYKKPAAPDKGAPAATVATQSPASSTYTVIEADEALWIVLRHWELEFKARTKLATLVNARETVARNVQRWFLSLRRAKQSAKAMERMAKENPQIVASLTGTVVFEDFVEIAELAYGRPLATENLCLVLFAAFEDTAEEIASSADVPQDEQELHNKRHVASLKIQLHVLRRLARKNIKDNLQRRSRIFVLLYLIQAGQEHNVGIALDVETAAHFADFISQGRGFDVNTEAFLAVLSQYGILLNKTFGGPEF